MKYRNTPLLNQEDARQALDSIAATAQRSTTLYRYEQASPYFFLWGAVWVLGYGSSDLWSAQAGWIWMVLDAIGVAVSIYIAQTDRARRSAGSAVALRIAGMGFSLCVFFAATFAVMTPSSGKQVSTFITLTVALAYVLVGLWAGLRWTVAGVAVAALALLAYFYVPAYFNTWMGFVGGGVLGLTGHWLRRV
jgi:hypothetical protein